jgi:hypothetical protein
MILLGKKSPSNLPAVFLAYKGHCPHRGLQSALKMKLLHKSSSEMSRHETFSRVSEDDCSWAFTPGPVSLQALDPSLTALLVIFLS